MRLTAVIWTERDEKRYVTPGGWPPTAEDIRLAEDYEKMLKNTFEQIIERLTEKGFFDMKPSLKKWFLLGKELQFLDDSDLRKKCDPDFEHTWRALYDLATDLAPTANIPANGERAEGRRNHFYMCYRLAKLPWNTLKSLNWRMWNDICMSFSPDMWKDHARLLGWLIDKSLAGSEKIDGKKLRHALIAIRHVAGEKASVKRNTNLLSRRELNKVLDEELKKQNAGKNEAYAHENDKA